MAHQDHYEVLAVPPSAPAEMIKKSFRRLAMRYHPDKHQNAPAATARFTAIQEAYKVLSDPEKRAQYNYERYLNQGLHNTKPAIYAAQDALLAAQRLADATARQNPYNIDRDLLFFQLKDLLTDQSKQLLQDEPGALRNFSRIVLSMSAHLMLNSATAIHGHLLEWNNGDHAMQNEIRSFARDMRLGAYWNRYKVLVVLALALLTCLMIYFGR